VVIRRRFREHSITTCPTRVAAGLALSGTYSSLSATIGSIIDARHAGMNAARAATTDNVITVPSYSAGRSTRAMAIDNCSHFDCSATSCFRPDRVSR
jgi:hypothetical protein